MEYEIGSIKKEFEEYAKRMSDIRILSSPSIQRTDSAESYSDRLSSNFKRIGELAAINRDMLDSKLYPLLNSDGILEGELSEDLQELADTLLNVAGDEEDFENLDLPIASLIAERLLRDACGSDDICEKIRKMDEQMIVCYSMMNMTERIFTNQKISQDYKEKGVDIGTNFLSMLDKDVFLTIDDMECREIVLTDARFMTSFYERTSGDDTVNRRNIEILDIMMRVASDMFYHEAVPDFDWDYFTYRVLEYYVQSTDIFNARGFAPDLLCKIADRADELDSLFAVNPKYFGGIPGSYFYPVHAARCRCLAGRMSKEEYREFLLDRYRKRDRVDFSVDGGCENVLIPLETLCLLDPENLSAEDVTLIKTLYQGLSAYLFRIPNTGVMSFLLEFFTIIITDFIEIPSGVSFEEFVLQCLAAMHPPTYVHSRMVGQISERLAYHILRIKPEIFIGMPGCKTKQAVLKHKEEILSYTYHAALCHDFGKISIIDTIFVYGRKLLDLEFNIIKTHPVTGGEFLRSHESTKNYADVAIGHHKWYDDSRGYPEDFKTFESPYKPVIDIVLCADCLDAATDTVGRSYNRGKNLADYVGELKEGSGTRYAPWLPEIFEDPAVFRDIEYLLKVGRHDTYQETYNLLKNVQENG
ncbi:MAG: HD domain-containing protein [Lachnospiraceae bacterium]|nr:HD domain-containing protein [Lachnospiraceae bacterium]